MYHSIKKEHSLFFINDQLVEEFKRMADLMDEFITLEAPIYISLQDKWVSVFNVWLLLKPNDANIIEYLDKTLYYSSNYIIINLLKNDYYFNFIKKNYNTVPKIIYVFAIILTNKIHKWFLQLIETNYDKGIFPDHNEISYYESHLGNATSLDRFMRFQAQLVKILIQNKTRTNDFERLIKKCSDDAQLIYENLSKQTKFQSRKIR